MGAPSTGKIADPAWRSERARKAARAQHSVDGHIRAIETASGRLTPEQEDRVRRIVESAGKLTPEQMDRLRSLLPAPDDQSTSTA